MNQINSKNYVTDLFKRLNLIQDCAWNILLLFNHSTWTYGAKFCKAIVTAVLHHFCVPVTLQSQNIINVNNPIKMMVNFQKTFSATVPKALIWWKFDWKGKVSKASATRHQLSENKKLILEFDIRHQIESLKNFNKTYGTWLILVLNIISKKTLKEKMKTSEARHCSLWWVLKLKINNNNSKF